MEKTDNRTIWKKAGDWFLGEYPTETYADTAGSVDSAGGTSPLSGVVPPRRATGPVLTERTALGIGPVYAAVGLIKAGISQLSLNVIRGGQVVPTPGLVARPDVRGTQTQFLAGTTHCLAVYGNAYWRLHRTDENPAGDIYSIEVLNPELVMPDWDKSNRRIYRYGDTTFADWQVKHLMIFPAFEAGTNIVKGVGPIQANHRELQAILERTEWLNDFYRNGAMPTGVLTTSQPLSADAGQQASEQWANRIASNRTPVLGNGIEYQPIQLDPAKAMYHESAQKDTVDVARIFRMPDRYLLATVNGSSMTYTNMQDVDSQFVRYTLMEYMNAIEDAMTDLLPRGQAVLFDTTTFLRGTTAELRSSLAQADWLTVNEKRAAEGKAPIAGGDVLSNTKSNEGAPPTN